MSEPNDVQIAQRLQAEEFVSSRTGVVQQQQQPSRPPIPPAASSEPFVLSQGHSITVRLHHVSTNRQIGEVVTAHYIDTTIMAFELTSVPGRFLKAKDNGGLDYAPVLDEAAKFRVEPVGGGNVIYLAIKKHERSTNRGNTIGWYLGLSSDGVLYCNGSKDSLSQWALIASSPNPVLVPNSARAAPVTTSVSESTFPGFDAGREALLRYFATTQGDEFLSQPQYSAAKALYRSGKLAKILHRPDWPLTALSFLDFGHSEVILDEELVKRAISFEQIKSFFEQGYMVLSQAVNSELTKPALKIVNYWIYRYMSQNQGGNGIRKAKFNFLELIGDICQDQDLLALYHSSVLPHLLQHIMGKDEVAATTASRVVCSFPSVDLSVTSPSLLGDQWVIEGFTKDGGHSPYNVLVGVALTDFSSTDMGNFCVHPGSHVQLLDQYREQVSHRQTTFSDDPASTQKPELGEPLQLTLRAGDAFICTQRLAHLFALNTGDAISALVFFRVSHIDHSVLKDPALESLWLEYKNASHYLENDFDPHSVFNA